MAASSSYGQTQLTGFVESKPRVPVFVDAQSVLDISNPTELFLSTAQPATATATTLSLLDGLQPWRLLPGAEKNRDWIRVLIILMLFPWNWILWRKRADELAKDHSNQPLVDILKRRDGKVVVFSTDFTPIAAPLIEALGFSNHISARLLSWRGQQHISTDELVLGSPFSKLVGSSIIISDSQEEPLLDSCQTPIVSKPRTISNTIQPNNAYVPLRYIHLTKNPRRKFIEYAWLKDDLYVVLLACSVTTAALFPLHAIGVVLASLALWITYEAGYHENDVLGEAREADPVLPSNFAEVKGTVPTVLPWVWAGGLTAVASVFLTIGLSRSLTTAPILALGWLITLATVRTVFFVFNRLSKPMRVIPHLLLQIGKYGGFAVISAVSLVGVGLLVAQVIYRWFPYAVYRWHPEKTFIEEPLTRTRLVIFWLIAIPAVILNPTVILGVQLVLGSLCLGRRAVSTHLRLRTIQAAA